MRLLFVTNMYPPEGRGGYELQCAEVAQALAARGHVVEVLTSGGVARRGLSDVVVPVHRCLELEVSGGVVSTAWRVARRRALIRTNVRETGRVVAATRPDLVLVWAQWNVPRAVPALLERLMPDRVVYYLCDYWPTLPTAWQQQLEAPARRGVAAVPKRFVARAALRRLSGDERPVLRMANAICLSRTVRSELARAGWPVGASPVVSGAIDTARFAHLVPSAPVDGVLRVLSLGRVSPEKGIDTAIEAIARLVQDGIDARLDVWGGGEPGYARHLRALLEARGLAGRVQLNGPVPHADVPELLTRYDVLVFPSVWPEPQGRTVVEALAAGLPVVASDIGGAGEMLRRLGVGGLARPGDAQQVAAGLADVARRPLEARATVARVRATVLAEFGLPRMIGEFERLLLSIDADAASHDAERHVRVDTTALPPGEQGRRAG